MRNETTGAPVFRWESLDLPGTETMHVLVCTECGAIVHPAYTGVHTGSHRDIWNEA